MIQGLELSPGVWVLQNDDTSHNIGVVFDPATPPAAADSPSLSPPPFIAIDPGDSAVELDALARFAPDMGGRISALLFTGGSPSPLAVERFPQAAVISPQTAPDPLLPLLGWQLLPLSPGRLALYNKKARTLFCGHMLAAASVPDLASGADNYLQALEQVEASPIVLLVPLHGPVAKGKKAIRERIAADRNYTQNLVRHALTSIAARLPLERVLSAASAAYEDYPYLDAHLRNLELVWNELSPS